MPRTALSPAVMPFRLQVPLAEAVEHRAWRHAHMAVLDAVERGDGVAVLGPPGSGKTMLLRSLARALEGLGWRVALVGAEGLATVPDEAGVLLLDEAGHLPPADLAAVARQGRPFVMAAAPGFATRLAALPRPVAWVTLGPMAPDEVARFVPARLAAAGRAPELFTPEAVQALARHSGGMVRLVLVLAGAALFAAESTGAERVTQEDVDEAAAMRIGSSEADAPVEDPAPLPVAPPPPAPVPTRVRLGGAAPVRPRLSRARLWWRRTTLGLAAAGLAMAAGAVVLVPQLVQRRAPVPEEAPMALASPNFSAPEPLPAPPPEPAPPAPPVAAPPLEPAEVAEPEPLPVPPAPPAAPAPRPTPRPRVVAAPPPVAAPLTETPVAPSPWSVGRLPALAEETPRPARIVTREPANIRRAPGIASPVVRVTSAGMVLRVFDRRGPWVQVGDSAPWGWVHSAVVEHAS